MRNDRFFKILVFVVGFLCVFMVTGCRTEYVYPDWSGAEYIIDSKPNVSIVFREIPEVGVPSNLSYVIAVSNNAKAKEEYKLIVQAYANLTFNYASIIGAYEELKIHDDSITSYVETIKETYSIKE